MKSVRRKPRIAFLGLGWIGRHRMQAIADSGQADIVALADPAREALEAARPSAPDAAPGETMQDLLAHDPDGVVIATPSALHATQSLQALRHGAAVFCQKPLGRTAAEVREVVAAARRADLLLGVDLSYRHTAAMRAIRDLIRNGELGDVFAADLVFHNAYGPDKAWFYERAQSGGGCVMDLGVHLVDLLLWTLDASDVAEVSSRLYAKGERLLPGAGAVEDFACVTIDLPNGACARLTCSWNLQAGCDAVIGAEFHGTRGGAALRNLNGSFYDFQATRHNGTQAVALAAPPDDWGGRAGAEWARQLARGAGFDPQAERLVTVAEVIDRIYGGAQAASARERPPAVAVR